MIHFWPPTFDITSFYLSLFTCTYKVLSWWLVVWLVGSATTEKKRRFSEEKENAASGQLAALRSSIFGPCWDRGLTQTNPTERTSSGPLNKHNTTPGARKKTNFRLPGVVQVEMVTA